MISDNYPMGCSDRSIGGGGETYECETCDGEGHLGSPCCGKDVGDECICPKCKEHADNETCPDCDGEGEIYISDEEADEQNESDAAERRSDESRGQ